jgi:hypothetical protein
LECARRMSHENLRPSAARGDDDLAGDATSVPT